MRFAVIVVDMHKDAFKGHPDHHIIKGFRSIIPPIKDLVEEGRKLGGLIIYTLDSYLEKDFLFTGKMGPHALRGTEGEELIADLQVKQGDMVLRKRRFSAFFRTGSAGFPILTSSSAAILFLSKSSFFSSLTRRTALSCLILLVS